MGEPPTASEAPSNPVNGGRIERRDEAGEVVGYFLTPDKKDMYDFGRKFVPDWADKEFPREMIETSLNDSAGLDPLAPPLPPEALDGQLILDGPGPGHPQPRRRQRGADPLADPHAPAAVAVDIAERQGQLAVLEGVFHVLPVVEAVPDDPGRLRPRPRDTARSPRRCPPTA